MKHWKTTLALILMGFAIIYDWKWFWAILILLGLLNVFITKEIHFVESIKKSESPVMYWIMVAVWVFFSVISIMMYLT